MRIQEFPNSLCEVSSELCDQDYYLRMLANLMMDLLYIVHLRYKQRGKMCLNVVQPMLCFNYYPVIACVLVNVFNCCTRMNR